MKNNKIFVDLGKTKMENKRVIKKGNKYINWFFEVSDNNERETFKSSLEFGIIQTLFIGILAFVVWGAYLLATEAGPLFLRIFNKNPKVCISALFLISLPLTLALIRKFYIYHINKKTTMEKHLYE